MDAAVGAGKVAAAGGAGAVGAAARADAPTGTGTAAGSAAAIPGESAYAPAAGYSGTGAGLAGSAGAAGAVTAADIAALPGATAWFPTSEERALVADVAVGRTGKPARRTPNARVVLMQPEIPENTGNIARTCACTGSSLTLVDPLGFQLSERRMKHAGLDYWNDVDIARLPNADAFFCAHGAERFWLFTGHVERSFADVAYRPGDWLVFGRESRGIDADILARYPQRCVRIPMAAGERSLNLSNSVAIAVYELLRQTAYPHLT